MKILLIGPGLMQIPPVGWGACESILYEYYTRLKSLGYDVEFTNTNNIVELVEIVKRTDADVIHCQYDDYIGILAKYANKPILGTYHYGYINQPNKWSPGYHHIYKGVLEAQGLIHLSEPNKLMAQQCGYNKFSRVLRNGCDTKKIAYHLNPSKDVICLGKIESRKKQAQLAQMMDGKACIDFVGPIVDQEFKENSSCKYLGQWTREEVYSKLSDYKALILLSDGENDPLVTREAMAAGCSLVISKSCTANLETISPWIEVLENEQLASANDIQDSILRAITNNHLYRPSIRQYAEDCFDWDIIIQEYLEILEEWRQWIK
jgi:glycosyltransferase involved in cell wall biosynthesis